MIACVNVVINNDDAYVDYCGNGFFRKLPTGGVRYASEDIYDIEQAAIECFDIVDKHSHTK